MGSAATCRQHVKTASLVNSSAQHLLMMLFVISGAGKLTVACICAGDKESYWMAFELAGIPYFYDNVYASAIGHITKDGDSGQDKLCPSHILHLDNTGRPFWYNGSLYLNKKDKKADRKWMHPTVWALASGKWLGGVCLLQPDAHALSDGGYDIVYQQMVQAAEQANADVDALIA